MANNTATGGKAPKISNVHVVALYDPADGRIAHMHMVTIFEGGRAIGEKEAIDKAVAFASKAGHQARTLKVKVSNNPAHGRHPHRIDIKTGEFVSLATRSLAKR